MNLRGIILEGCDLTGKSTLAEALKPALEARYPGKTVAIIHSSVPAPEFRFTIKAYLEHTQHLLKGSNADLVILDRHHLSGFAYNYTLGNHQNHIGLPLDQALQLNAKLLREFGLPTVCLYFDNVACLVKRYEEETAQGRVEMFALSDIVQANQAYEELVRATAPHLLAGHSVSHTLSVKHLEHPGQWSRRYKLNTSYLPAAAAISAAEYRIGVVSGLDESPSL